MLLPACLSSSVVIGKGFLMLLLNCMLGTWRCISWLLRGEWGSRERMAAESQRLWRRWWHGTSPSVNSYYRNFQMWINSIGGERTEQGRAVLGEPSCFGGDKPGVPPSLGLQSGRRDGPQHRRPRAEVEEREPPALWSGLEAMHLPRLSAWS